jgi:hypothetical protein
MMSDLHISEMDAKDWWDKYLPKPPMKPAPPSEGKEESGVRGLDPKHYGVK